MQGEAAAPVPLFVIQIQPHRLVERRERLLVTAERMQGEAAAPVPLFVIRIQPHRLVERRERLVVAI